VINTHTSEITITNRKPFFSPDPTGFRVPEAIARARKAWRSTSNNQKEIQEDQETVIH